jgi:hypothetical protein
MGVGPTYISSMFESDEDFPACRYWWRQTLGHRYKQQYWCIHVILCGWTFIIILQLWQNFWSHNTNCVKIIKINRKEMLKKLKVESYRRVR